MRSYLDGTSSIETLDGRAEFPLIVASALSVLINISASSGFGRLASENWLAANVYDSFARASVPIFILVAGSIILRDRGLNTAVSRLLRLIVALLFWSLAYILWKNFREMPSIPFTSILSTPANGHLWVMQTLIGLTLFSPIIVSLLRFGSRYGLLLTLLAIAVFASILPFIRELTGNDDFSVLANVISPFLGYALVGALLTNMAIGRAQATLGSVLYFLASAIIAVGTYYISYSQGNPTDLLFVFTSPLVVVASCGLFVFSLFVGRLITHDISRAVLAKAADASLGAYLVHVIVAQEFARIGINSSIAPGWISIPVVAVLVWVCSLGVATLLRSIPKFGTFLVP